MTTLVFAKNATAGDNETVISAKRGRLRGYDAAALPTDSTTIAFHDCATTGAIAGANKIMDLVIPGGANANTYIPADGVLFKLGLVVDADAETAGCVVFYTE